MEYMGIHVLDGFQGKDVHRFLLDELFDGYGIQLHEDHRFQYNQTKLTMWFARNPQDNQEDDILEIHQYGQGFPPKYAAEQARDRVLTPTPQLLP